MIALKPIHCKQLLLHKMDSENTDTRPNLYLVGFMGTGKSTIGRRVAQLVGLRFIDSDDAIEKSQGRPISEIFATEGEPYFRQLELEFIESGHPSHGCVVSCGGGLVVQPGMTDLLRKKGVVVSLFASPETILRRTSGNSNRPLLNVEDPEQRIRDMLAEREPHYLAAGSSIMTDGRGMHAIADNVIRIYKRHAAAL